MVKYGLVGQLEAGKAIYPPVMPTKSGFFIERKIFPGETVSKSAVQRPATLFEELHACFPYLFSKAAVELNASVNVVTDAFQ